MPASRSERPRGILVAAEGLDGSGKSAGLDALGRWLERKGRRVHHVRWEPSRLVARATRGPGGRRLVTPLVAALLAAAEASDRIEREVRRPLARGDVVLADRYGWTAVARECARGLDPAWAAGLYRFAPVPDLVVFHRQDADAALARALASRPTPSGAEAVAAAYAEFLDRLVDGYERLVVDPGLGPWPVPVLVLEAGSPAEVRSRVARDAIRPLLEASSGPRPVASGR